MSILREYSLKTTHQIPVRLRRLAPAEVAQRPGRVPEHAELVVLAQESQQGAESTLLQDVITALWAVTGDVTQSPNSLLPDIVNRRREQLDELRDSASTDDGLSVVGSTRCDICERPGGFELQTRGLKFAV